MLMFIINGKEEKKDVAPITPTTSKLKITGIDIFAFSQFIIIQVRWLTVEKRTLVLKTTCIIAH